MKTRTYRKIAALGDTALRMYTYKLPGFFAD